MRTKQGLEAARAQGKVPDRPKASNNKQRVLDPFRSEILTYLHQGLNIALEHITPFGWDNVSMLWLIYPLIPSGDASKHSLNNRFAQPENYVQPFLDTFVCW
jgi:hypothetical protein